MKANLVVIDGEIANGEHHVAEAKAGLVTWRAVADRVEDHALAVRVLCHLHSHHRLDRLQRFPRPILTAAGGLGGGEK